MVFDYVYLYIEFKIWEEIVCRGVICGLDLGSGFGEFCGLVFGRLGFISRMRKERLLGWGRWRRD